MSKKQMEPCRFNYKQVISSNKYNMREEVTDEQMCCAAPKLLESQARYRLARYLAEAIIEKKGAETRLEQNMLRNSHIYSLDLYVFSEIEMRQIVRFCQTEAGLMTVVPRVQSDHFLRPY